MNFFKIILILLSINFVGAQSFYEHIQKLKNYDTQFLIGDKSQLSEAQYQYLNFQKKLLTKGKADLSANQSQIKDSIISNILLGDYYLYNSDPNDSISFSYYNKALNSAINEKDTIFAAEVSKKILSKIHKTRHALESYPNYINIYKKYAYDNIEKYTYLYHKYNYQGSVKRINQVDSLKILYQKSIELDNYFLSGKIAQLIGVKYDYFKNQLNSSLLYYEKAQHHLESKPYQLFKNELFGIYGNIGLIHQSLKNFELAKFYFLKADSIKIPKYRYFEKEKINIVLSDNAKLQGDWQGAYFYLDKRNRYADSLNEYEKAKQLNEINIKYQTEKKEKENLVLERKRKKNQNIAIGLGGSLVLGSIIAFLLFKNTKRKQKLAEQAKEIESQKLATVLKEQELNAIGAMIEGQEKERQRIANDLHDDLGGLMATVKLHFNAFKDNKSPELFDKTNRLIEEAYQKVRSVAHTKNSGVIAKHGLLKSVKEMAEKISISNQLQVEVIDYGLETRLENSLELTIFRITQELVSNAVKHAEASEITIHITNHEDSLNLMVEDNGKGFNTSQITKNSKGMGISSIDKRVEHLNGKMTIESEKNKGTTIIIDIPI